MTAQHLFLIQPLGMGVYVCGYLMLHSQLQLRCVLYAYTCKYWEMGMAVALFPGLLHLQCLIACSTQELEV